MNAPARAVDLVFQEPAVLRMRYGRQAGIAAQVALMIALMWVRPFSGDRGTVAALLLEGLMLAGLAFAIVRSVRRVRANSKEGGHAFGSLRDVVFLAFPRPVAHIFMSEITIWIGLWRLASRPFRARELEFSYHGRLDLGMLVVVLVTAPVEILLFELLIPWAALRWFLLAAALYSAIWFVGITFAPMIHQHVARPTRLILRNGGSTLISLRYADIAAIEPFAAPWPDMTGRFPAPLVVRDGCAWLQYGGQGALRVRLREPQRVGDDPASSPVTSVVFAADQPAALIAAIEDRMPACDM